MTQKEAVKLLLKKSRNKHLIGKSREKGLTMVPIKVYTIKGKIKIEFAIVRGKKKFDKREQIKKRQSKKDIERIMKRGVNVLTEILSEICKASSEISLNFQKFNKCKLIFKTSLRFCVMVASN